MNLRGEPASPGPEQMLEATRIELRSAAFDPSPHSLDHPPTHICEDREQAAVRSHFLERPV